MGVVRGRSGKCALPGPDLEHGIFISTRGTRHRQPQFTAHAGIHVITASQAGCPYPRALGIHFAGLDQGIQTQHQGFAVIHVPDQLQGIIRAGLMQQGPALQPAQFRIIAAVILTIALNGNIGIAITTIQ